MKLQAILKTAAIAAAAGVSLASATNAVAGDWYAGVGVSASKIAYNAQDYQKLGVANTQDDRSSRFGLIGGYQFTPNWALEGGYADIGKFRYKYSSSTVGDARDATDASALNLAAVGLLPVFNAFSLVGKLGVARVQYNDSYTYDNSTAAGIAQYAPLGTAMTVRNANRTRTGFYYGLGLQYDFSKSVGLRGLYEDYGSQGSESPTGLGTGRGKLSQYSAYLVFKF